MDEKAGQTDSTVADPTVALLPDVDRLNSRSLSLLVLYGRENSAVCFA
jgi:hypothetical protein